MVMPRYSALLLWTLLFALATTITSLAQAPDFNRDIRPILSDKCFSCHGFDEKSRQADLRLDVRENAIAARDNVAAIVPGKPDESALIRRIESPDPDERMPPPDSNKSLTDQEKGTLRRWVVSGAEYQGHWSFSTPKAHQLPQGRDTQWIRNPIDSFV